MDSKTKRNLFRFCAMGTLAVASTACRTAQDKPNIIIVYADDVGYGDFSCYGATEISTPNVDRLASQGLRFTNAHTTSATSTPARYGLLTGQYPWRKEGTGIAAGNAGMIISPDQYTMADMLHDAGYVTGAVGKWHLGLGETARQDWNGTVSPGLSDIGFDYSYIMAATGDRVPCVFIENSKVVDLDPSDPIEVSYDKPFPGEPTGKDNPEMLRMGLTHGHDQSIINGISRIGYMKGGKSALWRDEDIADRITDKALEFIDTNKDRPFFLYFGTNDIHVPRVPHERFIGKSGMRPRGDAILSFDYCLGRLLDTLDSLGLTDNTLLILSSDNGPIVDDGYADQAWELLGNHRPGSNLRGGKFSAFEAGTNIPMIVRWPGHVEAGTESDVLFSHIDIYRSLEEVADGNIPENAAPDSRNSLETMLGGNTPRDFAVKQNLSGTLSIISGEWKYIKPSNEQPYFPEKFMEMGNCTDPQLYNLAKDPEEKENIASSFPEETEKLRMMLEEIINQK